MQTSRFFAILFIFKLANPRQCFTYLKSRLPPSVVKKLDNFITTKCRLVRIQHDLQYLQTCLSNGVISAALKRKIIRCHLHPSPPVCEQYIRTEVEELQNRLALQRRKLSQLLTVVTDLPLYPLLVFQKHCKIVLQRCVANSTSRQDRRLGLSTPWANGFYPDPIDRHIQNLSSVTLTLTEKQALSRGLKFAVPRAPKQPLIDAEFEKFYYQLSDLVPISHDAQAKLKADIVATSKSYGNTSLPKSVLSKDHFDALKSLHKNTNIVICPPDKGNAVVVIDRSSYNEKMMHILSDKTKFSLDKKQSDCTLDLEKQVSTRLTALVKNGALTEKAAAKLMPRGSCLPRLYGLPKMHKPDVPLRPILSMIGSPTHKLAQWLASCLVPISQHLCSFSVQDSFEFVEQIRQVNLKDQFMCSFDVTSLFTNVPLEETIDIIEFLISKLNINPPIPVDDFTSLLRLCTKNVQFSFDQKLFTQIDGVAMGSPLGPVLANIFLGYLEKYVLTPAISEPQQKPALFLRYVDDTFAVFSSPALATQFLQVLNQLHPQIKFTLESQSPDDGSLSFLDVKVSRRSDGTAVTSVYRKPTWSGLYLHFLSFAPLSYKKGLVKTLFDRSRKICATELLDEELVFLTKTLEANGYPLPFIKEHSAIRQHDPEAITAGPAGKKIVIALPFLGDGAANHLRNKIVSSTKAAYPAAEPRVIFRSQAIRIRSPKDSVAASRRSHVIYKFECGCGSTYVGRTERQLGVRISEHLPRWLRQRANRTSRTCQSAITRHAVQCNLFNPTADPCNYFRILTSSPCKFTLRILEALFISRHKPPLCKQKDFVYTVQLQW